MTNFCKSTKSPGVCNVTFSDGHIGLWKETEDIWKNILEVQLQELRKEDCIQIDAKKILVVLLVLCGERVEGDITS